MSHPSFTPASGDHTHILLDRVSLSRGATPVFANLSLELREHRIGLIGDNGAGKSSLFRLISGLEHPQSGLVTVHTPTANQRCRPVGMMFQNPDEQIIFPTVEEELALGLQHGQLSRRDACLQARAWLQTQGLGDWAERAMGSLSQGQRQRVCWLALQIAAPHILLLDEPFASLDLPAQAQLSHDIAQATQQVLLSTHILSHVRGFERVIWLELGRVRGDGPGAQVCAAYEADVLARSATP